jgi:hypothetical protein
MKSLYNEKDKRQIKFGLVKVNCENSGELQLKYMYVIGAIFWCVKIRENYMKRDLSVLKCVLCLSNIMTG